MNDTTHANFFSTQQLNQPTNERTDMRTADLQRFMARGQAAQAGADAALADAATQTGHWHNLIQQAELRLRTVRASLCVQRGGEAALTLQATTALIELQKLLRWLEQPVCVRGVRRPEPGRCEVTSTDSGVLRRTVGGLDGSFGADRGKRLVVKLRHGDMLVMRPERTRRPELLSLFDAYRVAARARGAAEGQERGRPLVSLASETARTASTYNMALTLYWLIGVLEESHERIAPEIALEMIHGQLASLERLRIREHEDRRQLAEVGA